MIPIAAIRIVRSNWQKAAADFNFKLMTPYYVTIDSQEVEVFAFTPDFGSSNGTIIGLTSPPHFLIDEKIIKWANKNKVFYSFININGFLNYDKDYFKEMLLDWDIKNIL